MLVNGRSLIVFATFVVAHAYAEKNKIVSLDDVNGADYVNSKDVKEMKLDMISRGNGYGTDWIVMPDGNGHPEIAILSAGSEGSQTKASLEAIVIPSSTPAYEAVTLRLFNQKNPRGVYFNKTTLDSLSFDGSKPTKFIIHGWKSSDKSRTVTSIRDAYLKKLEVNVITVDWSKKANNIYYPASMVYTKEVGRYVGGIIDDLVDQKGASYDNIHLIGHSLGAHTAAVAGYSSRGQVARITGLDPALPGFQDMASKEDRLDSGDANFVDVIHTCAGALGISSPAGHADFYPNGGTPFQPGCCCITELTGSCSHGRSHEYFSESILSKAAFQGIKCDSWHQFNRNACEDSVIPMGEYVPIGTRGTFYLETNYESPFGLGVRGTESMHHD